MEEKVYTISETLRKWLFLKLHILLLCDYKEFWKKIAFFKYENWFPSEVAKLTSINYTWNLQKWFQTILHCEGWMACSCVNARDSFSLSFRVSIIKKDKSPKIKEFSSKLSKSIGVLMFVMRFNSDLSIEYRKSGSKIEMYIVTYSEVTHLCTQWFSSTVKGTNIFN